MGTVYKGIDTMLDREVAIKVLKPELASQTSIVERFRMEALTLAKLNHPNIATLHSFFGQGEEMFMILEYVSGETLDKVLQQRGPLSCEEAIPIFTELLSCISHAHEFGVIHRDIKPANLMLTETGTLKVLDFGIARLRGSARITRTGNIIGTLEYMSPEQTKGLETDARSDIYSLGMTLYEILTGKTPFDTENEFELIQKQVGEMPVPPREINPDIPEDIEAAIVKSYAKDPDERFQTTSAFREVLLAGFDKHRLSDSFEKNFESPLLQFDVPKSLTSRDTFRGMYVESPETPTIEIVREKLPNPVNESPVTNGSNGNKIFLDEIPTVEPTSNPNQEKFQVQKSSSAKRRSVNYTIAAVGISLLLVSLVGLPFFFTKGEGNQPQVENKASVITTVEEKKPDVVEIPDNMTPENQTASTVQPPANSRFKPTVTTPQTNKKKKATESEAERLRRAEKLLTGN